MATTGGNAYIVTGPTSGIGRQTALELARHGAVVLVGRDRGKLDDVRRAVESRGGQAVPVVCDLSDLASARGEWAPGGSKLPGGDAYATSKQCGLATALAFARELPRLRVNAVEPGFSPGTDLGRDSNVVVRLLSRYVLSPLAPFVKYTSNPKAAARVITAVVTDDAGRTGVYYDEKGRAMNGSALVSDPEFDERVVAETRALLAQVPA
jgi:NAD(P)-dependent dehydrogenase (short-subunit alcohol dehydrogenase family)